MKTTILILVLIVSSLVVTLGLKMLSSKQTPLVKENSSQLTVTPTTFKKLGCTRTTRLVNKPAFDRALSIIGERYKSEDGNYSQNKPGFSFFPSQLVNCIKVIEGNITETTGAEGQFIFNDAEIRDNYFPIYVDKSYNSTDDYTSALLLVHEITHVEQYIKTVNKSGEQLSCIDKEVDAFYAQWRFPLNLNNDERRSIYDRIRIDGDKKLSSQLEILRVFDDMSVSTGKSIFEDECMSKANTWKCIEDRQKNLVKKILLKENLYAKQCNL